MSYNGSGTYSPPSPQYPAVSGAVIYASDFNTIISDIATALSSVLVKDGQTAMTGVLNFGGFKGSNLATPVATTDATTKAYVDAADALNLPIIVTADRSMYGYKITNLGTPTLATDAATKGYVDTYYGALAGAAWTGAQNFTGATITVPTQTFGDSTTKAASTAFVAAGLAALPSSLPSLGGNAQKVLKVDVGEATVSWQAGGIGAVTTATTATTLTNVGTLLKITPASCGVTVTLPDATTCALGGPLHIIDNRGVYPVRVVNNSGVLLGFTFGGQASYLALDDISTAAGVWAITNNNLVGVSAQLLSASMSYIDAVIDIGSSQEVIIGRATAGTNCYGVVYNRTTNTFGAVTLIRTAAFGTSTTVTTNLITACLSAANQVLVVSVPTGAATLEAVALSISGTTITVNTAATATLSANLSGFFNDCGIAIVGSSFVIGYNTSTPSSQMRALSISGTTVTIGSASVVIASPANNHGAMLVASSTIIIGASASATTLVTIPYTVSGSTLTPGTGTSTAVGTNVVFKTFCAMSSGRYMTVTGDAGSITVTGGVVSLSGTTTTISTATVFTTGTWIVTDAIIVGSNKLLVGGSTGAHNILTDTAGTASAGTQIATSIAGSFTGVSGTSVAVVSATRYANISCSGASPVLTFDSIFGPTVSTAARSPVQQTPLVYLTSSTSTYGLAGTAATFVLQGIGPISIIPPLTNLNAVFARGISDASRWDYNTGIIQKLECAA